MAGPTRNNVQPQPQQQQPQQQQQPDQSGGVKTAVAATPYNANQTYAPQAFQQNPQTNPQQRSKSDQFE